ncbi:sodium:proton exchanger [Candidatus Peregrinibacteria bacterium CG10_big_fil_rev_8_21_14_0_10_49_16]|nr:MAG: sodium:proton exchanger [Candidatus Peregrinibacteria bacterium CG22_combo_CG10-13_8_21_14_all_49_11]PIR52048.1 MAG: sodium:proton exchanger [Candidatus Peregrinibacteria bacterium CG10_big_fil_rev_8_21_14_0_10_49_16]
MMVTIYILGLLVSFYLLAKICEEWFVESLDIIAKRLKLSHDVAGATLMAVGSSAPEFFTALIALTKAGSENIGAGTIVGSAIFNVLVIVGGSAVVATAYLNWRPVVRDLLFYIVAILVLLFTFSDGMITLAEAIVYVIFYGVYILLLSQWSRWFTNGAKTGVEMIEKFEEKVHKKERRSHQAFLVLDRWTGWLLGLLLPDVSKHPKTYLRVFFTSIALIAACSWVLVELAVLLSREVGIPEVIIALTVLAGGTSIPDLLSSLIVAKQGRGDMAVSNAIGSNTFDILICLGLPWLVYVLYVGKAVIVSTENLISSIFLLFFTVVALLFVLAVQKFKIGHRSGYILIFLYILYVGYNIMSVINPNVLSIEQWMASVVTL